MTRGTCGCTRRQGRREKRTTSSCLNAASPLPRELSLLGHQVNVLHVFFFTSFSFQALHSSPEKREGTQCCCWPEIAARASHACHLKDSHRGVTHGAVQEEPSRGSRRRQSFYDCHSVQVWKIQQLLQMHSTSWTCKNCIPLYFYLSLHCSHSRWDFHNCWSSL